MGGGERCQEKQQGQRQSRVRATTGFGFWLCHAPSLSHFILGISSTARLHGLKPRNLLCFEADLALFRPEARPDFRLRPHAHRLEVFLGAEQDRYRVKVVVGHLMSPAGADARTGSPAASHASAGESHSRNEKTPRPRILLADDHASVIEQATSLLHTQYEIVGVANDGRDLIAKAERLHPDVIVSDISMPEFSGIEAARRLREAGSTARFVFLTVHEQLAFVRACMAEGALGYVIKSRLFADLVPAVADALDGIRFISPPVARLE